MKKLVFSGSAVALVTPMKADGSVNFETLEKMIEFQIDNGSKAIVACATTGESPVLSHDEHCEVIEFVVRKVRDRVPVIASSGSNDTRYAVELSRALQGLGADALLMITPYYNKTSQAGLVKHFNFVADRVDLPIILYNIPSRTGCNIQPETYRELAKHPNIVGTKEANGDIAALARSIELCGDDLAFYSGEDNLTLPLMSLGGKGVISTSANIIPREMQQICADYFSGDIEASRKGFLKYLEIMNTLFIDVNPIPVKAALNLMGFDCGKCRLPLVDLSDENAEKIRLLMEKFGLTKA